jgi:DNA-binding MarR family transcriptional regulator
MAPATQAPACATSDRLMYLFHRVRVATGDAVAATLADLELNGTLALVLETLYEQGETSAAELARRCLVSRQALTAPLNQLESRGLVRRPEPAPGARVRPTTLTADGRKLAVEARSRILQLEQRSRAAVEEFGVPEIRTVLERYIASWEQLTETQARSAAR